MSLPQEANQAIWFCLHLPLLGLELYSRSHPDLHQRPAALVAQQHLVQVNAAARAQGLQAGMSLGTAQSICSSLLLVERAPERERRALTQLAEWAWQFTSHVSEAPPDALLLEVSGSIRLFRGLDRLQRKVLAGMRTLGYSCLASTALTPSAALALARTGEMLDLDTLASRLDGSLTAAELRPAWSRALAQALPPRLDRLAVTAFDATEQFAVRLNSMGIQHLGQLLQLPRHALAQRFGHDLLLKLDRLTGRQPDMRTMLQPRPHFLADLHFLQEVEQRTALLFPMRRLLQQLTDWLRIRQLATVRIEWCLRHPQHGTHGLLIGCAEPEWRQERWLELTRLQLTRASLPPAIDGLQLEAKVFCERTQEKQDLFARTSGKSRDSTPPSHLLDLLQARLGTDACRGLALTNHHWPEHSQRLDQALLQAHPGTPADASDLPLRPLWLLTTPKPLATRNAQPCLDGRPLELYQGPERLEPTPWREGYRTHCHSRDYWIALLSPNGWYWIFFIPRKNRWYLHGLFA